MSVYIYAITHGAGDAPDLPEGVAAQPVYQVSSGLLRAFVSDFKTATIRPERRHIAASQGVLRVLQGAFDLLPMAFGTLTSSRESVAGLLDRHQPVLLAQLHRVAGAVEMGLRLNLEVPDPIAYLTAISAELQEARRRTFARRKPPSHDERIRLGQLCETVLRRYREEQTARIVTLLAPRCNEISTLSVRDEKEIANMALLVPRTGVGAFEQAVDAAAKQFPDDLAFAINGPWPPYNFVHVALSAH